MKIVFESLHVQEICEICIRIQTKYGRIAKEQSRIKRWRPEVNRRASINSAQDRIVTPEREIHELTGRRTINCRPSFTKIPVPRFDPTFGHNNHGVGKVEETGHQTSIRLTPNGTTRMAHSADKAALPPENVHTTPKIFPPQQEKLAIHLGSEAGRNEGPAVQDEQAKSTKHSVTDTRHENSSFSNSSSKSMANLTNNRQHEFVEQAGLLEDNKDTSVEHRLETTVLASGATTSLPLIGTGESMSQPQVFSAAKKADPLRSQSEMVFEEVDMYADLTIEPETSIPQRAMRHRGPHLASLRREDIYVSHKDRYTPQDVEVSWTCICGSSFKETVTEYKSGAAQSLVALTESNTVVDIERLAEDQDGNNSSPTSSSESVGSSGFASSRDAGFTRDSAPKTDIHMSTNVVSIYEHSRREYFLMCRPRQSDMILKHVDVTEARCDYTSYQRLNRAYYGYWPKFLRWILLKEISSVEFVKFYLYWQRNVSIDPKDRGVLPPSPSDEYSCRADTNPPVLKTALQHFIQHPDHALKIPRHRPRIPKKLQKKLLLLENVDRLEGYGIYIQEKLSRRKIFMVEAVFPTACVLFAVLWCMKNNGGIQDGFAIAGTGITYASVILGALLLKDSNR